LIKKSFRITDSRKYQALEDEIIYQIYGEYQVQNGGKKRT